MQTKVDSKVAMIKALWSLIMSRGVSGHLQAKSGSAEKHAHKGHTANTKRNINIIISININIHVHLDMRISVSVNANINIHISTNGEK